MWFTSPARTRTRKLHGLNPKSQDRSNLYIEHVQFNPTRIGEGFKAEGFRVGERDREREREKERAREREREREGEC